MPSGRNQPSPTAAPRSTAGSIVIARFRRYVFPRPSQCYSSTIHSPGESTCGIFPPWGIVSLDHIHILYIFANRHVQLVSCWAWEFFSQYELEFRFPISKFSLLLKVQVHPLASQSNATSTSQLPATVPRLLFFQISVRILILLLRAAL